MARFDVTGLQEVIRDMARMERQTDQVADDMLMAAAGVMTESWRTAIQSHGLIDTGAMYRAVGPTRPVTKGGVRSLTVYPQGKDSTGTRNAEKAFIANFGRMHQDATHFADEAERKGEEPAQSAMLAVWDIFIRE